MILHKAVKPLQKLATFELPTYFILTEWHPKPY